jgi:Bacterial regulatory helix-turn-helix protein, lysR family
MHEPQRPSSRASSRSIRTARFASPRPWKSGRTIQPISVIGSPPSSSWDHNATDPVTTWPGADPAHTDPAPIHHALLHENTPARADRGRPGHLPGLPASGAAPAPAAPAPAPDPAHPHPQARARQRRLLVTAGHASINQAAQALGIWPSSLYTQIADLERACGGPLIHRSPRPQGAGALTPLVSGYASKSASTSASSAPPFHRRCGTPQPDEPPSSRQTSASSAGTGSGRCGTSDSQVPGCPREASRRCRQEQHRPPDSLRCEGTPHERNGAKADQDDTSGNAHACDRTEVAVLPWRDYALHAGSRGRCPPSAQAFGSSVVIGGVHRGDSRRLWCPATPVTYQSDITLIGDRQEGQAPRSAGQRV